MRNHPKLCLLGQVLVDVTLGSISESIKLRFGGVFHAARASWSMDVPYELAFIAPSYLLKQIQDFGLHHGAATVTQIGKVYGSPNVVLIQEATEAGPQGYEFLLRDEHQCIFDLDKLKRVAKDKTLTDVMIFPGGFDLNTVLKVFATGKAKIHIDISYGVKKVKELEALGRKFEVIALSTSSDLFLHRYKGKTRKLCADLLKNFGVAVIFKENRGGSRFFTQDSLDSPTRVQAQLRPIVHSVGVGDCFDVVFAAQRYRVPDEAALAYASSVAAEYASTTFPDDFKQAVHRTLSIPSEVIPQLGGVSLPWEERPHHPIYIAAPDFDYVDRTPINSIIEALKYHNFIPRLPVREHGQMGLGASRARKQMLCEADLRLLSECRIVVAVLIENDPGTLIEIGIAVERGMPVVVYDPYDQAENLMLTELPSLISSNLDLVISKVFTHISNLIRHD
ncbi:MAG TPA: nucleoside 2-deoxyribosyltransferase [Pyrinomonadaceae bacterium]|jgi:nucleoside 2-deoxyribosyltransferase